jgi:hypothetical protein
MARSPTRAALRSSSSSSGRNGGRYPDFVEPCHSAERSRPPAGPGWLHKIKQDGYRAQLHIQEGKIVVCSRPRSRLDRAIPLHCRGGWCLAGPPCRSGWRGHYHALRSELARRSTGQLSYYSFDLLYLAKTCEPSPTWSASVAYVKCLRPRLRPNQVPALMRLALDIGLAGLALGMERVEFEIKIMLGRFAGVDRTALGLGNDRI